MSNSDSEKQVKSQKDTLVQSTLSDFSAHAGMAVERSQQMRKETRPIQQTGTTKCEIAGRVAGVHVLGVLHAQPLAIARVTGAITRYDPDVVAIEACAEAVKQYHPDVQDARWPPRDELEAAACATDYLSGLHLAGIDTQQSDIPEDFRQYDREIFSELGYIDGEDQLTRGTYYELDFPTIRDWRAMTQERDPEAFQTVIADRDEVMAGHLHALEDEFETIVAAVGLQHLTGVLDLLSEPWEIPDDAVEMPPTASYRLF